MTVPLRGECRERTRPKRPGVTPFRQLEYINRTKVRQKAKPVNEAGKLCFQPQFGR